MADVTIALRDLYSEGALSDDARAFHDSSLRPVIAKGKVLDGSIVPEGDRMRLPLKATLILEDVGLRTQEIDEFVALTLAESDD